jgi:hypothetical protein
VGVKKIAIAVLVIVLFVSLAVNLSYFYSSKEFEKQNIDATYHMTNLSSQIISLENQLATLQNQATSLQNQLGNMTDKKEALETQLAGNISQLQALQNQYAPIESQLEYFKNRVVQLFPDEKEAQQAALSSSKSPIPFLIARVGATDVGGTNFPYLYVTGTVYNVGTETANDVSLHVVLFRDSEVVADDMIHVGTLDVYTSASASQNIFYLGEALSNWTITPMCSNP